MLNRLRRTFPPHRFFSSLGKACELANLKAHSLRAMLQKYPHLKQQHFSGEIVYVLRGETPEAVAKAGGLLPYDKNLWVANTGSGNNTGSICFSLLPEITSIFHSSVVQKSPSGKAYIYAFPLNGIFLLPGGSWRQIISPGAFPLPAAWRARELMGIVQDRFSPRIDRLRLGPLIGEGSLESLSSCPRFSDYMNTTEHRLMKPKELPTSDDIPQEWDIIDTEVSQRFQDEVERHYQGEVLRPLSWKGGGP